MREERKYLKFWRSYSKQARQSYGQLYKNTGVLISKYIKAEVLDIGFGDVVNYDLSRVSSLKTLDQYSSKYNNPNVKHKHYVADARSLPVKKNSIDCVIAQFLFHHLAEDTIKKTDASLTQVLYEIRRVLKSDGEVLIVESFLPDFLELFEKFAYSFFVTFCRLISFPLVRQYSIRSFLENTEKVGFEIIEAKKVDKGPAVSQFGLDIPSWLTPVEVYFVRLKKN
jgi:ubiquinone/menaquinone biosynthesis C-methylase UbiE